MTKSFEEPKGAESSEKLEDWEKELARAILKAAGVEAGSDEQSIRNVVLEIKNQAKNMPVRNIIAGFLDDPRTAPEVDNFAKKWEAKYGQGSASEIEPSKPMGGSKSAEVSEKLEDWEKELGRAVWKFDGLEGEPNEQEVSEYIARIKKKWEDSKKPIREILSYGWIDEADPNFNDFAKKWEAKYGTTSAAKIEAQRSEEQPVTGSEKVGVDLDAHEQGDAVRSYIKSETEKLNSTFKEAYLYITGENFFVRNGHDLAKKFFDRLDNVVASLSSDPSISENLHHYSLEISTAPGVKVVEGNNIVIGTEALLRDNVDTKQVAQTIVEKLQSSLAPGDNAHAEPATERKSEDRSDFWIAKTGEWQTIFRKAEISDQAENWAVSESGPGAEQFLQEVDKFIDILSSDPEIESLLQGYRLYVHSGDLNSVMEGNIRVSARDLMDKGAAATAEMFVPKIREQMDVPPQTEETVSVSAPAPAPIDIPESDIVPIEPNDQSSVIDDVNSAEDKKEPVDPLTQPTPESFPQPEKSASEKIDDLIAQWEKEGRDPNAVNFLKEIKTASPEEWPLLLEDIAGMTDYQGSDEFQEISEIIGNGITKEQIANRNRAAAGAVPREFENKIYTNTKERFDPVRVFMREQMHLNDDEINAINFEYSVIVGEESRGEPPRMVSKVFQCSNYHDFLREREKLSPEERSRLDGFVWGNNEDSKVMYRATNFWKRLKEGGDLVQYSDDFNQLLYGVVRGEYASDDFATWVKTQQSESQTPTSANIPQEKKEPVSPLEEEKGLSDLSGARNAYAKAYREYLEKNKDQSGAILGIGGDSSVLESARAAYDVALKAAAEERRNAETSFETSSLEGQAKINKKLFEEFVVNEEKILSDLRAGEMPPREESWYKQAWLQYARLPRWQKVALSAVISTTVAAGTGIVAGAGIGLYAGRRILSATVGAGAGAATTAGFEVWDKTKWGKKGTKEYQVNELLGARADDISQVLGDMGREYRNILEQQADREKKRMYLKVAVAALAGAGTSMATGFAIAHPSAGGAVDHGGAGRAAAASHETVAAGKPGTHSDVASAPGSHKEISSDASKVPSGGRPSAVPSAEKPSLPVEAPKALHIVEVKQGDSLWRMAGNQLKENKDFNGLNDAEKTWVVSTLTNRAIEHKDLVGFQEADHIAIGTKLNLSSILKDDDIGKLLDHAKHLTQAQQDNILANNHAIADWLHENPHQALTGGRVAEIIHDREHPGVDMHSGKAVELEAPEMSHELRPEISAETGSLPSFNHAMDNMPLQHGLPHLEAGVDPSAVQDSIEHWNGDVTQGAKLLDELQRKIPYVSHEGTKTLLAAAAHQAGDIHPAMIDPADSVAVARQMKDYLVAYPEARRLGFNSYEHWAGVRDIPLKKFMDETAFADDPKHLSSALRHSFWYRGARIDEMVNGKLHKVPFEPRHAMLATSLRGAPDLIQKAPGDATVGSFLGENYAAVEHHNTEITRLLKERVDRADEGVRRLMEDAAKRVGNNPSK